LDIIFATTKLEKLCNDDKTATRSLGTASARKLRGRLDDLQALKVLSPAFQLPGRFHPLSHDRAGQYAFELQGGCRLVVEPFADPLPKLSDGSVDLTKITAVKVVFVGDYHD